MLRWMLALIVVLSPATARAALNPAVSDEQNGKPAAPFAQKTVTGEDVSLDRFAGKPVALVFFASWCPPCREEIAELKTLAAELGPRGLAIIGAASDRQVIPDTTEEQERKDVAELVEQAKVPFPVTIATRELAEAYHFKGIPTTIFIDKDRRIAKTFYGVHDAKELAAFARTLLPAEPAPAGAAPAHPPARSGPRALLAPFVDAFARPGKQLHPVAVHFPIVFLATEALLVLLFRLRKTAPLERLAYAFLHAGVWSMLVAAALGIRDSGLERGAGNLFVLGLEDRIASALRFESSITVHAWLMLGVLLLSAGRLVWRARAGARALEGARGLAYGALTALTLWCLVAGAYVGGLVSHP